jgi:phosphohistidine phosphatase SixA
MKALARLKPPRATALVGHEPWLGMFLSGHLGCERTAEILFAKGGAALVKVPDGPAKSRGKSSLMWLMTQDQLAGSA